MKPFRADILRDEEVRAERTKKIWFGVILTLTLVLVLGFAAAQRYFFHDSAELPADLETLWTLGKEPSFVLLDKNGEVLARRGPRYGQVISVTQMPKYVVQAFLAMEDQRFYDHDGVDKKGILRAAWVNWRAGKTLQGGSTITQQLVKLLLLTPDRTVKRKVQEMRLAQALETRLSKDEILTLYLNRIYLGNRAYGIDAAADRYFQKSVTDLSLSEAAMLAALPKAPSRFAPHLHPDEARTRSALVLQAMVEAGFLDEAARQDALSHPAKPRSTIPHPDHGYIFDLAVERALAITGGRVPDLVIATTIDPFLQNLAETKLRDGITKDGFPRKVSQGALISVDRSGAVRAIVGGLSYRDSKFNRAYAARRQPGSAFKAFVYAAAFEAGIRPASVRRDEPIEIAGWSPGNYGGGYRGRVTVREAFRRSINTVAAQITNEIGAARVAALATRFGISGPLQPLPSIALGAQEVSLWELTQAFGVFGNGGELRRNFLIRSIASSQGKTLFERPDIRPSRVYDDEYAKQMTGMMQEVVLAGTGRKAKIPGRQVAGKTGTSQQWRDAWFVGFSAQLTTGIWLGNDDNTPMAKVTGGSLPAQIWQKFMVSAHKDLPVEPLKSPEPQLLSESDEGLAAFYGELAAVFGALESDSTPY
ncbi:MAG: penicillin-binding protein [Robiginitomaculum sp.]|nr:MAG: penicillin-binding protein [Robiginitomaculum sp.]